MIARTIILCAWLLTTAFCADPEASPEAIADACTKELGAGPGGGEWERTPSGPKESGDHRSHCFNYIDK